MVIGDAVVGNRVSYSPVSSANPTMFGTITGTNGAVVQVIFDRDIPTDVVSEVAPSMLTLVQDGGYFGSLEGQANYQ